MQPSELLAAIEDEIARLNQARALLAGSGPEAAHRRVLARAVYGGPALRKRRTISAAGRARIAAAQKVRWAKVKSAAKRAAVATPSSAANRPKTRKASNKASATKPTGKKRAAVRRAAARAAAPASQVPTAESSGS